MPRSKRRSKRMVPDEEMAPVRRTRKNTHRTRRTRNTKGTRKNTRRTRRTRKNTSRTRRTINTRRTRRTRRTRKTRRTRRTRRRMKGGGISTYKEFIDFLDSREPLIPHQFDRKNTQRFSYGKEPYLFQILHGIAVMSGEHLKALHDFFVEPYNTATKNKETDDMVGLIHSLHNKAHLTMKEYLEKKKEDKMIHVVNPFLMNEETLRRFMGGVAEEYYNRNVFFGGDIDISNEQHISPKVMTGGNVIHIDSFLEDMAKAKSEEAGGETAEGGAEMDLSSSGELEMVRHKIHEFLDEVGIGTPGATGATSNRGFDSEPMIEFAHDHKMHDKTADEIYAAYVEHQMMEIERSVDGGSTPSPISELTTPSAAPSPSSTAPSWYRALHECKIRAGPEMGSDGVGKLEKDEVIKALSTEVIEGKTRVRIDRGWVSLKTSGGKPMLEPHPSPTKAEKDEAAVRLLGRRSKKKKKKKKVAANLTKEEKKAESEDKALWRQYSAQGGARVAAQVAAQVAASAKSPQVSPEQGGKNLTATQLGVWEGGIEDEKDWIDLSPGEVAAAARLGWVKETWDEGGWPEQNGTFDKSWDKLTEEARADAMLLGYNKQKWDLRFNGDEDDDDGD